MGCLDDLVTRGLRARVPCVIDRNPGLRRAVGDMAAIGAGLLTHSYINTGAALIGLASLSLLIVSLKPTVRRSDY